jgi:hypothetical protein
VAWFDRTRWKGLSARHSRPLSLEPNVVAGAPPTGPHPSARTHAPRVAGVRLALGGVAAQPDGVAVLRRHGARRVRVAEELRRRAAELVHLHPHRRRQCRVRRRRRQLRGADAVPVSAVQRRSLCVPLTAMQKSRIVACGIPGERPHTQQFRGARFPFTRLQPVPGATRTALGFGICRSFEDLFLSRRAKP